MFNLFDDARTAARSAPNRFSPRLDGVATLKRICAMTEDLVRCGQVLVVANPANTNALILKENAPSIPPENITCLTRLDHNRALGQVRICQNLLLDALRFVSCAPSYRVLHARIASLPYTGRDELWRRSTLLCCQESQWTSRPRTNRKDIFGDC
jgi:hypothetical protein